MLAKVISERLLRCSRWRRRSFDLAGFVAGTFGRGVPFVNYDDDFLQQRMLLSVEKQP